MHESQAVTFRNRSGCVLFGIMHLPEQTSRKNTAIVLLSPGVKNRIAPHRLYVKLTEFLISLGYPVFRFDFYGLGDSEGVISERLLPNIYTSIQQGLYINDTIDSMDWLQDRYGIKNFIVGGLCGGAITGLLAAQSDERVTALLAIGIPVILDNAGEKKTQTLTSSELDHYRGKYFLKLTDVNSLIRLLTLKSDFRAIFKALINPLKMRLRKITSVTQGAMENDPVMINFNYMFPDAFETMLRNGHDIGLFFGENDRLYWEFKEKYCTYFQSILDKYSAMYSLYLTPGARHIFEQKEQQVDLFRNIEKWLTRLA